MFTNYNINWLLFIKRNVAHLRRKPIRLAWLRALIAPVVNMYLQFMAKRAEVLKRLQYNGQVIYLEKGLNDTFNVNYPATFALPIYIGDPSLTIPEVVFYADTDSMNTPAIYADSDNMTELVIYADIDYYNAYDFIVWVPITLYDFTVNPEKITEIRAFVNLYKQCDKNFNILNY